MMRKELWQACHEITALRYAITATIIALMVSTSLAVGLEFVCYALALASPQARARFMTVLREPLSLALLLFAAALIIGTLHGYIPWQDRLNALIGWRRLLFFYLAAVSFDDNSSKKQLISIYLLACVAAAVVSFITAATSLHIGKLAPGIVVHNHATQGLFFSIGVGVAVVALLWHEHLADDRLLGHRYAIIAAVVLLVANISFITPGRSGYLALLVIIAVLVVMRPNHVLRASLGGLGAIVAVGLVLSTSGTVRDRMELGFKEITSGDTAPEGSSMGVRRVFWRNTAELVREHPIFGVGTGSFEAAYRQAVSEQTGWQATVTGDPHNQFLKIWTEQGIIGLAAILTFIGVACATKVAPPYRQLAVGILLAWCATSLFNSHFSTFVESRMFFFWLGALLAKPPPDVVSRPACATPDDVSSMPSSCHDPT